MVANESPTETSELVGTAWLEDVKQKWLRPCGYCDAMVISAECTHPSEDYRPTMLRLVETVERLSRRLAARFEETERLQAERDVVQREAEHLTREVEALRSQLAERGDSPGVYVDMDDIRAAANRDPDWYVRQQAEDGAFIKMGEAAG